MSNMEGEIVIQVLSNQEVILRFLNKQEHEVFEDCIGQILPILNATLSAADSSSQLGSATPMNRLRAVQAVRMLADARIQEAAQLLVAIPQLVEGELKAESFGFPEFNDDADSNWAD